MGLFFKSKPAETPYEREHREKFEKVKQIATVRYDHYLAAPFTAQCAAILQEKIAAGQTLRDGYPIRVTYNGIVSGPLGYTKLIMFNDYGYNNFSNAEQRYGFLFALCTLLGSEYCIEYGPDLLLDGREPYIVRKKAQLQYRDI